MVAYLIYLLVLVAMAGYYYKTIQFVKKNHQSSIDDLKKISDEERKILEDRVNELETSIETGYGIKVRRVINRVECDFNIHEIGWIAQGLLKMVENPKIEYLTKKHIMEIVDKTMQIAGIIAETSSDPNVKKEIKVLHKELEKGEG